MKQRKQSDLEYCDANNVVRRTSLHGKALMVLVSGKESNYRKYQAIVYNFLERPKSHASIAYHIVVFTSVLTCLITSVLSTVQYVMEPASNALVYMELVLLIWFFVEYVVRIWSSGCRSRYQGWRGRLRFARRPFCIVDVILIVSSVVVLAGDNDNNVFAASALRGLRFFQILRMIRVDRRAGSFKLLAAVVYAHRQELLTTMYIGFLGLIFSSFLIYLVEKKQNQNITSYADALWWGVITLCTVGYGDTVPQTWIGKVIAACCAVAGISFFALPASILGSGFALKVQQQQRQKHLIRRRIPAATLIQCLWRCYAADKRSTSQATWAMYRKAPSTSTNLWSTGSFSERSGIVKFGQRLSTIRRKTEKPKPQPAVNSRSTASSKLLMVNESSVSEVESLNRNTVLLRDPALFALDYSGTVMNVKRQEKLRHSNSDCRITHNAITTPSLKIKDFGSPTNPTINLGNSDVYNYLSVRSDSSGSQKGLDGSPTDTISPTFFSKSPSFFQPRSQLAAFADYQLTEDDKTVIRVIRKFKLFVARRKFREALKPYDVKDVIEQYSVGHLDMLTRVKNLQSRLDQILGRQSKASASDTGHKSLASRIVGIESNMRKLEKKMDIMLQVCQGIAREKENGGSLKTLRKRAQCQHPNNLSGLEASALLPPDKRDVQPGHQNRFDASHYSTYLYTSGSVSCGTMNNAPIRDSAMLSAFVRTNSCFDFQAQGDDLVVNRKRPRSTLFVPPNVVFNVDLSPSACETSLEDCKSQEYMNKPPVAGTTKKKNLKWRTSSEHSIGNYPEKPCLEETVEYAPKSEPSK